MNHNISQVEFEGVMITAEEIMKFPNIKEYDVICGQILNMKQLKYLSGIRSLKIQELENKLEEFQKGE